MKNYYSSMVRVGSLIPDDHIKIGGMLMRVKKYEQLTLTRSTRLTLADVENPDKTVILTLGNEMYLKIYNQK